MSVLAIASALPRATAPVERIPGARSTATRGRSSAQNMPPRTSTISPIEPAPIGTYASDAVLLTALPTGVTCEALVYCRLSAV
jgi:hypothetical protein